MFFKQANPIWQTGRERELNVNLVFKAQFGGNDSCSLNITAKCLYRAWLNGKFLGYGPARAAHGYSRVDTYTLNNLDQINTLIVEVAGYYAKSFYTTEEPSFIQAEITRGEDVIVATGRGNDFTCHVSDRLQKVFRFSYQRPHTEYYVMDKDFFEKFSGEQPILPVSIVDGGKLIGRGVDFPLYTDATAVAIEQGIFEKTDVPLHIDRINTNPSLKTFPIEELERCPAKEINGYKYSLGSLNENRLNACDYRLYKFENSETGFIGLDLTVKKPSTVYIIFDEVDFREDKKEDEPINIHYLRNDTYNIIGYDLAEGEYNLLSFEVYTAQYVKVLVSEGCAQINGVTLKRYENNFFENYKFEYKDKRIQSIVMAAARTYAHNAVDIPTDCPSRERAGWLCDSYFSGRSEKFFTGKNTVERNFLENYAIAPQIPNLPEGMIAMCYPADFESVLFIPNWSMWYLVELKDYFIRTNDREMIDISRNKVDGLLKYFSKFENSDGLLEDLENWVFVEWSMANDAEYIKGVNYPSNMLYAKALECVADLYDDLAPLKEKATAMKDIIRKQSYNGKFFEDNAVRVDGKLTATGHTTETCQYYAFYLDVATVDEYPELFATLCDKFGPNRDVEHTYPAVYPSNAFIGNYLRLEILLRQGFKEKVLSESVDYFYKMAKTTGTLWEHDRIFASLNHGFASYAAYLICQCIKN